MSVTINDVFTVLKNNDGSAYYHDLDGNVHHAYLIYGDYDVLQLVLYGENQPDLDTEIQDDIILEAWGEYDNVWQRVVFHDDGSYDLLNCYNWAPY